MFRILVVFVCLSLGACAAAPPPADIFDSAERAIEAAEKAGAGEASPTELRFARERLELARVAVEKRKYEEALMAIEQSEINAELAIEQSLAAQERRRVNDLRRSNQILQEELTSTYGDKFE